ncbi:ISLre2 family transposase [Desulforudis sp. 1088]|uniref:ISLre2 family transposase n=1 Tax=unclassified Candidatus Desulforudis TaxID=2635950 RepID=UPI003CE54E71
MEKLHERFNVSFLDCERFLWTALKAVFSEHLRQLLELLDEEICRHRDKDRYKVLETVSREVETLVGPVRFRRRCYLDVQTGERVYLLDEVLQLPKRSRISPGLIMALALLGTQCPSYRMAEDNIREVFGERICSHETVRQVILQVGRKLQVEQAQQRESPQGKLKVPVLLLEVDGLWTSLQREKDPSKEIRILVSHEGWERRHPCSNEYMLRNKLHFTWDGRTEEFWEEASRYLVARYDLENTLVVINGDRASWIRKGVQWFPRAIYQVDRFHLQRDIRSLLKGQPERQKIAKEAFEASDEGLFLATLAEAAAQEKDPKLRRKLEAFVADLSSMPEALRDYRKRLPDYGIDPEGFRGLGAAESQMDLFSNRLKKRGQSWRLPGLRAILATLTAGFEGRLHQSAEQLERAEQLLQRKKLHLSAGRIMGKLGSAIAEPRSGHLPVTERGRNASGGLSLLMRRLSHPLFSTT